MNPRKDMGLRILLYLLRQFKVITAATRDGNKSDRPHLLPSLIAQLSGKLRFAVPAV